MAWDWMVSTGYPDFFTECVSSYKVCKNFLQYLISAFFLGGGVMFVDEDVRILSWFRCHSNAWF